jgi:hypothetical protein
MPSAKKTLIQTQIKGLRTDEKSHVNLVMHRRHLPSGTRTSYLDSVQLSGDLMRNDQ